MSTQLTDAELARLEELAGKATPGPLTVDKSAGALWIGDVDLVLGTESASQADMNYIAAACNAAPALVAEVRRLRDKITELGGNGLPPSFYENEVLREKIKALEADKKLLQYVTSRVERIHENALTSAPKQAIGESLSCLCSDIKARRIRNGDHVETLG